MTNPVKIDLSTAYEEAQAETQHWRNRALIHAEGFRKLKLIVVKGGEELENARARLIEQMGGEEAIAHLMAPQQQPETGKEE